MIISSIQRTLSSLAIIIFVLSIAPPLSIAQQADPPASQVEPGAADAEGIDNVPVEAPVRAVEKRYLVELIVFNYHGPITAGGEIWHRAPPIRFPPTADGATPSVQADNPPAPGMPLDEPDDPIEFTVLKRLKLHLAKLHANPQYEVVTYTAWTQPLFEKNESISVELIPSRTPASTEEFSTFERPALKGSLQLFENRLLFVKLDISNEFKTGVIDPYGPQTNETNTPAGNFRLHEKRRVKLNELHYFDHPYFGALVRVSRWQPGPG